MMNAYDALALAYTYPRPGRLEQMQAAAEVMPAGAAKRSYQRFTSLLANLTLSEWEELHTRTLDLSPLFAPYIGYITWGENYQRGAFLANMTRVEQDAGIETDGELADHLDPILRYLGRVDDPIPELAEVVGPAVTKMHKALRKAEPNNPYVDLLVATKRIVDSASPEESG